MHELVIFDCDGVLVDSETITQNVLIARLKPYGLLLQPHECAGLFVGGTMQSAADEAIRRGADLPKNWVPDTYEAVFTELAAGTPAIDNVVSLLDHLDEIRLPYCVASNGPMEKMRITLGQNGLWERFEGRRWSAHDVGRPKPDPGLFLYSAQALGARSERCVVIEDSISGVKAAIGAGMRCLGYAPEADGRALHTLGAEVFQDMAEVPALLAV